jgi:hypothetical protein
MVRVGAVAYINKMTEKTTSFHLMILHPDMNLDHLALVLHRLHWMDMTNTGIIISKDKYIVSKNISTTYFIRMKKTIVIKLSLNLEFANIRNRHLVRGAE